MINQKLEGDSLEYLNKVIKYISTYDSNRMEVLKFINLVDKNLLKNEHYIIMYYIEFFCSVKSLARIDLNAIRKLVAVDREMFVESPHLNLEEVIAVEKDDHGALIEQMVNLAIDEIESIKLEKDDYENSMAILEELVNDLEIKNSIYTSTMIYYEGMKIGKKFLKGREGYLEFIGKNIMEIRNRNDNTKGIQLASKEYLYSHISSSEKLFPHPIKSVQEAWGHVRAGESLAVMAPTNIGKTTLIVNYIAESLMNNVNTGLFISEVDKDRMIARIISTVGARKYDIKIPTDIVLRYLNIDKEIVMGAPITEEDKKFLKDNDSYINNAEFIFKAFSNVESDELGTLYILEDLVIRDMDATFEDLSKEKKVRFLIVDHVNGVQAGYTTTTAERVNTAYIRIHTLGKKYGVANVITNHIPQNQIPILMDPESDKGSLHGANAAESARTPDRTMFLRATMEQKNRKEFEVLTNKDRSTSAFFDNVLVGIHIDVGMVYEIELD